MAEKSLKISIQATDEGRLDKLISTRIDFSRARVRGLLLHGKVKVNDTPTADAGTVLRIGDVVELLYDVQRLYRDPPKVPLVFPSSKKSASARSFQVIYSDETLVVVNKEAGLLTVPTDKRESQNLLDLLTKTINPNRRSKLGLVHRLDRETSGLLVFGQDENAAHRLIQQFKDRKPERIYWAIVKGHLETEKGTLRSYLKSDKALNQRSNQSGDGELAITHYEVIEKYSSASLIKVQLETGRRNQIRAHFAELGHPVLGDQRYEKERAFHRAWPYKRLALHAAVLGFEHPKTQESMRFEQELPKEFTQFFKTGPVQ